MQYLVSVIHDQAGLATPDEMAAIDVFNDRLQAEGHWVFAGYWGARWKKDPGINPTIADALNTRPKYVASTTLTDPQWADTTVLSGDVAAAIRELKAKPGGELQVHGSGTLTRWLLENELVDEVNLLIVGAVRIFQPVHGARTPTTAARPPDRGRPPHVGELLRLSDAWQQGERESG